LAEWLRDGTADEALQLTGQRPHVSAPSAILAWIREHEPERFARIGHVLACKDWLRACLSDTVGTDRTEASTSFTDLQSQFWSSEALRLYGLGALDGALPPVAGSAEVVGQVTPEAAALTGLRPGTPVAAGLHDVTASALGIGGHREGVVAVVAGTYSINEVVTPRPVTDLRWFCRAAVAEGLWHAMAISPASTANYDWFLDRLCTAERQAARAGIHDLLAPEIAAAFARPSSVLFHPYLYGSPHGETASAGFLGLQGWHDRGDMLRAVLEGIAFNHRLHVDALRDGFAFEACRLTGGASRNPLVAQLFSEEAAAWGAALCAGAAVGLYRSPQQDPRNMIAVETVYEPDPQRQVRLEERYVLHCRISDALAPLWPAIGALAP
jgi:L-xylulokinase